MIEAAKLEGKTLVFLKPCDTYSFNQLIKEHRVDRDKAYIIGVGCQGTLKPEKIREAGIKGIETVTIDGDTLRFDTIYGAKEMPFADALLERCKVCKGKKHMVYDELIGAAEDEEAGPVGNRFEEVEKLEAMSPRSVSPSGRSSFPSVSAATPAVTYVRPAAAANVYSTVISTIPARRPTRTPLRSRCSTSSVLSMWQDAVLTAASAAESVPRAFRFTC